MAQPVFPFSVPESDTEGLKLVLTLKKQSRDTGVSFSRLVIDALKEKYNDK